MKCEEKISNPQNQKAWKAEYAKSGRSSCRTCKSPIASEVLRLRQNMWIHAACILKKANQIKSVEDVENIESLRRDDQQKIRKYIESGDGTSTSKSNSSAAEDTEYGIEVSQTSRATCRDCGQKIIKGEVRISTKPDGQGAKGLGWHHAKCLMELSPSIQVDKLSGWNSLSSSDQSAVSDLAKKGHPMNKGGGSGTNIEMEEGKESTQKHTSKGGIKWGKDADSEWKSKVAKAKGDVSVGSTASVKNYNEPGESRDLENKLEIQSKELWALKDDLKKHVTTAELREMLEANGQDSTGSELDLRDRCADGMMFGGPGLCPICSGFLRYSGGMYRCNGYISEWSKCSYSTCEPKRIEGKWKIPEETNNQYLKKWFKSQKGKKPVRILPLPSPRKSESQITSSQHQSSQSENLRDLKVAICGLPNASIEE